MLTALDEGKRPAIEGGLSHEQCEIALDMVPPDSDENIAYRRDLIKAAPQLNSCDIEGHKTVMDLRFKALSLAKEYGGDINDWDAFRKSADRIMAFVVAPFAKLNVLKQLD